MTITFLTLRSEFFLFSDKSVTITSHDLYLLQGYNAFNLLVCGVEFLHSTRNASRIQRGCGTTGVCQVLRHSVPNKRSVKH